MEQMIFADGMTFKARHENAPETVRGSIYFKYPEFARFMEQHKNEKGYVNIKMMKSKEKGTIYFILDTWKPNKESDDKKFEEHVEQIRRTSPSPEYPDGIDVTNHPLVEENELDNIPF